MKWLAAGLHGRCRWRLPVLLGGILFATGRRTAASWLRAAGISTEFSDYYYFIATVGRKANLKLRQPTLPLTSEETVA